MEIQQCKVKSTFPALSQSHSGEWKRVQGLRKARFERETWTYFALLYLHNGRGSYLDFEPLGVLCLVTSARSKAPDGFDAVSVQNVGSTYIIVSWDLPTHSNGILINFSLYCNGALAGVLPLTVISYDTTGLLLFTLYMYITLSVGQVLQSRPQALHSSWNVVLGVISAAASLPRNVRRSKLRDAARDGNLEDVITLLDEGSQIDATDWVRNIVVDVVFRHVMTIHGQFPNSSESDPLTKAGDSVARRA
ncbi:hypothetical protein EMCRGX_G011590 [Ephydatia muelleri]